MKHLVSILQHSIIEKINLMHNRISEDDVYASLSSQYSSNNVIMNFINKIPLLFIIRMPHLGNNISCIYLMKSSVDSQVLQKMVSEKKQFYNVFIVDDVMRKIHKTVQYHDSSLIIYPLPPDFLINQKKIITVFKY